MTSTTTLRFAARAIGRPCRSMVGAPVDASVACISDDAGNVGNIVFANPTHGPIVAEFIQRLLDVDRESLPNARREFEAQALEHVQ